MTFTYHDLRDLRINLDQRLFKDLYGVSQSSRNYYGRGEQSTYVPVGL